MSCMTADIDDSNFPNLHKFEQKIKFWIFGALSYFQGSAVQHESQVLDI